MTEPSARLGSDIVHDWTFDALGTGWTITVGDPIPNVVADAVTAELARIDRTWSRFRDDSIVAQASRQAGRYAIAATDQPLVDWYRALYDATAGAVTPFVGQTLVDAGYDAQYSLVPAPTVRRVPAWDEVLHGHDRELLMTTPALIDVGAAGKGFAVDRVAKIIAGHTATFIVDGSGDLVVSVRDLPLRVGLEHPANPATAIGVVELTGGAICASSVVRRSWSDWHHVIDGRTSAPARGVVATWAVAESTMIADGLATALFFTPARELRARLGIDFDYVTMYADGTAEWSAWPGLEMFS
ncbi:MAG TPA: FAD:protein FMN transferase [Gordonia sp. (in: high G+C Gram-positive bacteria)]|uniref:FAD:protein FMN transferase n=1 Tax=unclassified Gordonia (in: high G+C Gram-positive bacteria) TaxID=2657482 RepID=UPI0025B960D6|nr:MULTISPECIES: FAD:protein FMN transferase [unclassified Gordonia (in: high G+C Gram-positive bacteria)]HNP57660.1 FAD:protein FMN transferase [Gordonia sp. (in: high G+C Gram-positive bacteria)]HRC50695.1 FAD:protein FMN transferase [Gordonia sp. (in: high G+C Gram-positive bacteria)]